MRARSRLAVYSRMLLSSVLPRFRCQDNNRGFGPAAIASVNAFGISCLRLKTGSKRSPRRLIRLTAAAGVKKSSLSLPFFTALDNSSQVTGIEIKGPHALPASRRPQRSF